jgi:FMN phosphatase YigB (HAD superfamily)
MKRPDKPFPPETKLIIWDLDGTLYPYDYVYARMITSAVKELAQIAVKEWGLKPQKKVGQFKAAATILKSLIQDGNTDHFIQKYNLMENGVPLTHEKLFTRFKQCLSEQYSSVDPELKTALEQHGVRQVVLTHSETDLALRVMDKMGIVRVFNKDRIFGIDQLGGHKKESGKEPFEQVLAAVNKDLDTPVKPEQVIMVDDKAKNLRHPKEMGMCTVLLEFKSYMPRKLNDFLNKPVQLAIAGTNKRFMPFVDRVFETPLEFLKAFAQRREPARSEPSAITR